MRGIWLLMSFWAASAAAQEPAADLRVAAEAFAGTPVELDPRLPVPACPGPLEFAWRGSGRQLVMARCASTGWQLGLPLAVAPTAAVLVRRGQSVQVVAEGSGYRVSIDGVAEGEGRAGGLVLVRNVRTGRKFLAAVGPDGRLLLARAAGGA